MKQFSARLFQLIMVCVLFNSGLYAEGGVTLVGHIDKKHGGPGAFGFFYASCWGYVAPDGHEYALIGCVDGTSIIDLDADPLREVAYVPGASSIWKEMKTWGHYAYVVSEGPQGVQIINLSQLPDTAWLVKAVFDVGGKNVSTNHTVTVADGYLYLNGSQNVGTRILSLADPENPTYVGEFQPEYLHDTYVHNDILYGAAIQGNGSSGTGGVYIASLANKAAPQQIGHITYPNSGTHNAWASVDGRYVFTTDETRGTRNMKVFDISNVSAPVQKTPFTPDPAAIIHNVHGRGNYIYVAHYESGVFVADVHDPLSITNAGGFDTYPAATVGTYAGCWGVYPYFPSSRWIASDTQTGLYVLRFSELAPRIRSPLLSPADDSTVTFSTPVTFRWRRAADQVEDPHYYKLHIWGPGVDTLLRANDSSLAVPAVAGFQSGQMYSWHVWINDEFTSVSSQDTFRFVYVQTSTDITPGNSVPERFVLFQNYPNPFNPSTLIRFRLPVTVRVTIGVYDLLGQQIATLVDGLRTAGTHEVKFDASGLPTGVYLYKMTTESGFSEVKKMVVVR